MWMEPSLIQWEMVQILNQEGQLVGEEPSLSNTQLLDMYRWMIYARVYDERAVRLQRQGRMGTYAPFRGQEAAQIGSAFAIERSDWVFPSYRELPVVWVHGLPLYQSMLYTMGHLRGGHVPPDVHAFPVQIIIAAQTLHAMGSAWASQYLEDGTVSLCYLGDGATSQGDFHEALNFASVLRLPVVFFIQNNQWAISVPRQRQSASQTLAQKALAYGMPGVQVDGNDVLAVYKVTKEAAERARLGGGPVLVEAVTFRHGAHTTSDDPTRYRDAQEVEKWIKKDPIVRFQKFLSDKHLWTETLEASLTAEANQAISEAVEAAENTPVGTLEEAMELVYAQMPENLRRQRDEVTTGQLRTLSNQGQRSVN